MTSNPTMPSFSVTPTSLVNGDSTSYKVAVSATTALVTGDQITFTIPSEVTLPSSLSCSAGTNMLGVTCTKVSSTQVKATLQFSGGTLASGTSFDFTMNSITNPPSTLVSSSFSSVSLQDTSSNTLESYTGTATV